ncbi:MAG: hypothetical protein D6780_08490, partial [Candidatus Dadabacteria bacterium]
TYKGYGIDSGDLSDTRVLDALGEGANIIFLRYYNPDADTQTPSEYVQWVQNTVIPGLEHYVSILQENDAKAYITLIPPPAGRSVEGNAPVDNVFRPENGEYRNALIQSWSAIAEEFNSNSAVEGYLPVSEPAPQKVSQWKDFAPQLAEAIRGADTTPAEQQPYIVVSAVYGNPDRISTAPDLNIAKQALGVNMFFPWAYTHQGIYTDKVIEYPCDESTLALGKKGKKKKRRKRRKKGGDKDKKGKKKKKKHKNKNKDKDKDKGDKKKKKRNGKKGKKGKGGKKGKPKSLSKEGLAHHLRKVYKRAKKLGMPVFIGEFAVARWAPGGACYLRDATQVFDENKTHVAVYLGFSGPPPTYAWDLHYPDEKGNNDPSPVPTGRLNVIMNWFSR